MTSRAERLDRFLDRAGWGEAKREAVAGDASTRSYMRLCHGDRRAIVMDAPPEAESPAGGAGADAETRRRLGYNALAALAGPSIAPFVALAQWLTAAGFSAPRILAADLTQGFLVLEDLGDALYTTALAAGEDEMRLYSAAIDVLAALHEHEAPPRLTVPGGPDFVLKPYDPVAVEAECALLAEWYVPLAAAGPLSESARRTFLALWRDLENVMKAARPVLVLRDYHAQNLLWLPQRAGLARVGLLDFQDAVLGHPAYDLVSLLEDARRDVKPELAQRLISRYMTLARQSDPAFDGDAFGAAYAAWGAQRNTKILGIFARLARRDGKPHYLAHIPRVWRYLERDLAHPALAPLRAWFDRHLPPEARAPGAGVSPS